MKRRMKAPSPALVVSVVALFVALAGTSYAATRLPANSVGTKQLKNKAVTKIKLSTSINSSLTTAGTPGTVLSWDAPATASPSPTTIGTALGDTWAAACALTSGHADLEIFLKTSDGSLTWDLGQEINTPSTYAFHVVVPAGTLSTFQPLGDDEGATAPSDFELEDQGVQLSPVPGNLGLHISVIDTTTPTHTCHMTIDAIPQPVTTHAALHPSVGTTSNLRLLLGRR